MLRITASKNGGGASAYFEEGFQKSDYYSQGQEHAVGRWGGDAAKKLGLSGEVQKQDFVALCENKKPDGTKLNPRQGHNRKVYYDFTFSVPKSVSTVYALNKDERIKDAFEQSVEETMRELEQDMRTQTGQGMQKQLTPTGNMVWASFTHRTSRPVNGIPDPHLHRHCVAFNTTWYAGKQRFQAGEFSTIKKTASYYEAAYFSRLAWRMEKMGYAIERRGLSWEIKAISDSTLQKFSRRTAVIEQRAKQEQHSKGNLTAKQKEQLGALTRAKKIAGQSWQQLQTSWRSWLTPKEQQQLDQARTTIPNDPVSDKAKQPAAIEALSRAESHLFERKSVVKRHQLQAETLKRCYGSALPEDVQQAITQGAFHQREVKGNNYLTTPQAVEEEYSLLRHLREGRGSYAPLNPEYQPKASYLNDQQKAAIHHALTDRNQVTIIAGGAGTGKTTLVKEIRDGVKEAGKEFYGFAPSAAASRDVMRKEGFTQADTLARLLVDKKLQQQTKGGVIWVDEAGMIGNKDMNKLLQIAKQQQARLLLTGDTRQHNAVAAGDALRICEQEGGLPVARVSKIQRQRHSPHYKMAVRMAAEGKGDAALLKLDRMGEVVEVGDKQERMNRLVADYAESKAAGRSALIISPTHAEGAAVTQQLRSHLQATGQLQGKEQQIIQLQNEHWTEEQKQDVFQYQQGEKIIEFHQNAKGHKRGERWQVTDSKDRVHHLEAQSEDHIATIPLNLGQRFTVYQAKSLSIQQGERIRLTKGGKTLEGTKVNNGDLYTVTGFTKEGHLRLHTGKTLSKTYGHLHYGYVTTSHSAQGKTVDHVFLAQSSQSSAAASKQQFYVSLSRGRQRCRIYTDDKKALEQAVKQDNQRMTAREIAAEKQQQQRKQRQTEKHASLSSRHYGKSKEL